MKDKTVLITGANKSIGFETARQLGLRGYRIWLACRDKARGQAALAKLVAEGIETRIVERDVSQLSSVQAAAQYMFKEEGQLDILINNAGISGVLGTHPSEQSIDEVMAVYDTNVFGAIRVTQGFLPLLKAAVSAKIIMVSSGLGSLEWVSDPNHPYFKVNELGYNSSKTALNAVTLAFAKQLKDQGISVNAVDPGYTATDFNEHSGYRSVTEAAAGIVWLAEQSPAEITGGFYFDQHRAPW